MGIQSSTSRPSQLSDAIKKAHPNAKAPPRPLVPDPGPMPFSDMTADYTTPRDEKPDVPVPDLFLPRPAQDGVPEQRPSGD